jgi:hypothetical protein
MKDEDTRVTLGKIKDMIEQLERKQLPAYQRYVPEVEAPTPKYIRLPKAGTTCPYTGLARSAMNNLVLPTAANGFNPPVKSFCLRRDEQQKKGVRLVDYASLMAYIESCRA